MDIKDEIKAKIIQSGWKISDLVTELHKRYGWSNSVSNFSNKLAKETLRYKEALEISEVLGYRIQWLPDNLIFMTDDEHRKSIKKQMAKLLNEDINNTLSTNKPSDE